MLVAELLLANLVLNIQPVEDCGSNFVSRPNSNLLANGTKKDQPLGC